MSIITRVDAGETTSLSTFSRQHTYDQGLSHDHHWARDRAPRGGSFPRVADAACIATPSSAQHDDILFAAI